MRTIRWWLKWSTLKERVWEPVRRRLHRVHQLRTERDYYKGLVYNEGRAYREALDRVMHELGVPGEGYPTNVANAWYIADAALNGHRFAAGDEEHASNAVAEAASASA